MFCLTQYEMGDYDAHTLGGITPHMLSKGLNFLWVKSKTKFSILSKNGKQTSAQMHLYALSTQPSSV